MAFFDAILSLKFTLINANMNQRFSQWLLGELDKRGWSFREFGRRADLSRSTVSKVVNGMGSPGCEFCLKTAKVLNVPPENVLRRAGLLSPEPKETVALREMSYLFTQLSLEDQAQVLVIVRAVLGK